MSTVIVEIERLYNDMKEFTLKMGVPKSHYETIVELDGFELPGHLEERLRFLERVISNEYKEAKSVRSLLPEEIWQRYEAFGVYSLTEQKLLKAAKKKLKKVWENYVKIRKQEEEPKQNGTD